MWKEGPNRDELVQLGRIAAPISAMLMARFGMEFTDVSVLGHLGTQELAAAATALIIINTSASLLWRGFGGALNTLCSQAYGANNMQLVGEWALLAVVVVTCTCIPVGTCTPTLNVSPSPRPQRRWP